MLKANIIGAGLLGKTLGFLFHQHQALQIEGIYNTTLKSAKEAINFIGSGSPIAQIQDLAPVDITLITTPDNQILNLCEMLCHNNLLQPQSIILHCSGALTSRELSSAKQMGCFVASVHPMRSFANPALSAAQYQGTYCAVEGDREIIPTVMALFHAIGSHTTLIHADQKPSYHAAGVFASNYLVTLANYAQHCLRDAGIEHTIAKNMITNIMKNTVENLVNTPNTYAALTGPIKRGDITTIKMHLSALGEAKRQLYASLGLATCSLAAQGLSQNELDELTKLLANL